MAINREQVIDVLKQCYDPEIPIDLWNLGLIYDIQIEDEGKTSYVDILMSLTTPGCGMGTSMADDIKTKLEALPEVSGANVVITFDPQWAPEMMTDEGKKKLGFEPKPVDVQQSKEDNWE